MIQWIYRHLQKGGEGGTDAAVRERCGKLGGMVGLIANLFLCTLKIVSGLLFGSVAILADGINNLSDASASLITLLGFKMSGKAPDKEHPYGHGRSEYLAGLMVAMLILLVGVTLLKTSVEKTVHPEMPQFSVLLVAVLLTSILIKLWLFFFYRYMGKQMKSEAMLATAADSRNDVITTTAVLGSVLVSHFFGIHTDGPLGIVVALFILWSGVSLVRETLNPILGKMPDRELVKNMEATLCESEAVLDIHDLMVHDYGPARMFASVHCEVDASGDMMAIHDEIDNLERRIFEQYHVLLTIHIDPVDLNDPQAEKARADVRAVCAEFSEIQSFHDVRVVSGPTNINVVFDVVLAAGHTVNIPEMRAQIDLKLKEYNKKYRAVVTVDNEYTE